MGFPFVSFDDATMRSLAQFCGPGGPLDEVASGTREGLKSLDWRRLAGIIDESSDVASEIGASAERVIAGTEGPGGIGAIVARLESHVRLPSMDPGLWSSFVDTLTGVSRRLESFWQHLPSAEALRRFHEELCADATALGAAGWTWPMDMNSNEVHQLLVMGKRQSGAVNVDRWLVRHHEARFPDLALTLTQHPRLRLWRRQVKECLGAYRRGWFGLVVPQALSVFEGVVSDFARLGQKVLGANTLSAWVAKSPAAADANLDLAYWLSAASFTKGIWAFFSFEDREPKQVNRHWVNHGRSRRRIGRADALRLLAAIRFIADLIEDMTPAEQGAA